MKLVPKFLRGIFKRTHDEKCIKSHRKVSWKRSIEQRITETIRRRANTDRRDAVVAENEELVYKRRICKRIRAKTV